jgi:hypothetical protein
VRGRSLDGGDHSQVSSVSINNNLDLICIDRGNHLLQFMSAFSQLLLIKNIFLKTYTIKKKEIG